MAKQHHVIYVPGLRDTWIINKAIIKVLPFFWEPQGIHIHVFSPHWEQGTRFAPKLKQLTDKIDSLVKQGHKVSLVGQSAGGSATLNAFCIRKSVVHRIINSTGRLRAGNNVWPSLKQAAKISPAFKESVLLFEKKNEPTLTKVDRKRILTIRPLWDETVPASTVPLDGATNLIAPIIEHSLGGIFIVSFYSKVMLDFLKEDVKS